MIMQTTILPLFFRSSFDQNLSDNKAKPQRIEAFSLPLKKLAFFLLTGLFILSSCTEPEKDFDIIVYGGTSAGVIAAVSADREGKSVLLIEPGVHLGGLSSGGLGQTDIGNKHAVTGLSRDFYRRLGAHYGTLEAWKFEPSAAEKIFNDFMDQSGVEVLYQYRLRDVGMKKKRIQNIVVESSTNPQAETRQYSASFYIDCSYEGDLMAASGVSYTVGRESNDTYGETYNGVQMRNTHQFPDSIDPYIIPGDSSSGLCWGIQDRVLAEQGSGDHLVQAYNYRLCLTKTEGNKIDFTPPPNYDPSKYELLRRVVRQREKLNWIQRIDQLYLIMSPMPNGKTDINNKGPFSTDGIGMNWEYPEADYNKRAEIALEVENYIRGLLYFMANDESMTPEIRSQMNEWGWAADEFTDNNHFPHQMYVREARRMIGEYVMTEHNCMGDSTVEDGIGLAAYTMDSHNCQRIVVNGMVKNEGDVQIGDFPPYEISYRSLIPQKGQCENLFVPVCLSASHIAFGSIRMEPVFMVLGQVTGLAASNALDAGQTSVHGVDVPKLVERLKKDPLQDGSKPDIIIDNSDSDQVESNGGWKLTSLWMGQNKADHMLWMPGNENAEFTFKPALTGNQGRYNAYLYVPRTPWGKEKYDSYDEEVRVEISTSGALSTKTLNFNAHAYDWLPLGIFDFSEGDYVKIYAGGNQKPVPADALLLVPEKD